MTCNFPEWDGNLKTTLDAGELLLDESKYEVIITVRNSLQKSKVLDQKPKILNFLRKRLENSLVQLSIRLENTTENLRPYTPKDKFEFMAKKNPALRELKETLNLEVDF